MWPGKQSSEWDKGVRTEECGWPLKPGKGKDTDSLLAPPPNTFWMSDLQNWKGRCVLLSHSVCSSSDGELTQSPFKIIMCRRNEPSHPKSFPCLKIANILNQQLSQRSQICMWRFGLWLQGVTGFHEVSHQRGLVACSLSWSFHSPLQGRLNTKQYYGALDPTTTQRPFISISGIITQVMCSWDGHGPWVQKSYFLNPKLGDSRFETWTFGKSGTQGCYPYGSLSENL